MDSEQRIFYAAALKGSETYTFWVSSLKINPDFIIEELAEKLLAQYAKSHQAFAVDIYKLRSPTTLDSDTLNNQLPNHAILLRKAVPVARTDFIKDAIPDIQSLIVLFHCAPSAVPVVSAAKGGDPDAHDVAGTALKALHDKAWGKRWPQHQATIYKQEIGLSEVEYDENYAYPPPDSNIPDHHTYTCLENMNEVATALKLSKELEDVAIILDEYNWLRKELDTIAPKLSAVIVGQPGIGKTTFLLYLLLYRLERRYSTAIQFDRHYLFVFDEQGAQVYSPSDFSAADRLHNCWALSDSNTNLAQPCSIFRSQAQCVIQASSPQASRWNSWTKEKASECIFSALPHVLEIGAALKELKYDPALTLKLVSRWGPSLRIIKNLVRCPRWTVKYTDEVQDAAKKVWKSPSSYIYMSAEQTPSGHGFIVLFLRPCRKYVNLPDSYTPVLDLSTHDFFIPTKFLTDQFMKHGPVEHHRVSFDLFTILSSHFLTRTSAGWTHEKIMHHRMCNGGAPLVLFRNKQKACNDNIQMNMQPSTVLLPGTLSSLKEDTSFYWMPSVANFAGVDGALSDGSNIFMLQATIAADHSTPLDGIAKVWKKVSPQAREAWKWHFVAVADTRRLADSLLAKFTAQLAGLTLGKDEVSVQVWVCVLG